MMANSVLLLIQDRNSGVNLDSSLSLNLISGIHPTGFIFKICPKSNGFLPYLTLVRVMPSYHTVLQQPVVTLILPWPFFSL